MIALLAQTFNGKYSIFVNYFLLPYTQMQLEDGAIGGFNPMKVWQTLGAKIKKFSLDFKAN